MIMAGGVLVRVRVAVSMAMTVMMAMIMPVMVAWLRLYLKRTHCAFSPRIRTFSSSESELRIAVVLSSKIFL